MGLEAVDIIMVDVSMLILSFLVIDFAWMLLFDL